MNPWLIIAFGIAVIASAAAGYNKGYEYGEANVQQAWDKERAEQEAAFAKAQAEARAKEQELQANADKLRQEKDREIKNISARATALSHSLRDRPERPTAEAGRVPESTGTCAGATGKELARGDGEFLAGYAADAARLQAALDQCVRQYEALRPK